jgi:PAS domain S-box-containing protein
MTERQWQPPAAGRPHSKTMRLDILPGTPPAPAGRGDTRQPPPDFGSAEDRRNLFEHLFAHAYDATLIADMRGRVLAGNLRAHEFLGRPGESLPGRGMADIISGADDTLIASLAETLAAERFARITAWCRRGDGGYFPADMAVRRISAGQSSYLCFFIRDISRQKEAEERLRTVVTAVQTTRTGIAVADLQGKIVYANPAMGTLRGIPPGAAPAGDNLRDWLADEQTAGTLLAAVRAGESWHGEAVLRRADGARIVTACDTAGNVDSEGELAGAVLSFADLTDRLRALRAERTVERNRVMMESIGAICHYLGQPSTVLLNGIELLQRLRDDDRREREELLGQCREAVESLCAVLRQLNDLRLYQAEDYIGDDATDAGRIIALPPAGMAPGGSDAGGCPPEAAASPGPGTGRGET